MREQLEHPGCESTKRGAALVRFWRHAQTRPLLRAFCIDGHVHFDWVGTDRSPGRSEALVVGNFCLGSRLTRDYVCRAIPSSRYFARACLGALIADLSRCVWSPSFTSVPGHALRQWRQCRVGIIFAPPPTGASDRPGGLRPSGQGLYASKLFNEFDRFGDTFGRCGHLHSEFACVAGEFGI